LLGSSDGLLLFQSMVGESTVGESKIGVPAV
jgi:hypothetical protein